MTPKEKAEELINKMYYTQSSPTSWQQAKQCALIAADEALNMFIEVHKKFIELDLLKGNVEDTATYEYWIEVKQEIEKL